MIGPGSNKHQNKGSSPNNLDQTGLEMSVSWLLKWERITKKWEGRILYSWERKENRKEENIRECFLIRPIIEGLKCLKWSFCNTSFFYFLHNQMWPQWLKMGDDATTLPCWGAQQKMTFFRCVKNGKRTRIDFMKNTL